MPNPPYPNFGTVTVGVWNGMPNAPASSIAAGGNWNSGVIPANGFPAILVAANSNQTGAIEIQRYADLAGTLAVGNQITAALSGTASNYAGVNDGLPWITFVVIITNTGGVVATLSGLTILLGPR